MIKIARPSVETADGMTTVSFSLDVDGTGKLLWFRFSAEYGSYLTVDRGDALLAMMVYYAMEHGHDLVFEMPVSERLFYQVKYNLVDALHKEDPSFRDIAINCEVTAESYERGSGVGTAISCGIDSLTTLYTHNMKFPLNKMKVNQLTFFNVGAFNYRDGVTMTGENGVPIVNGLLANAMEFSVEAGLPLLYVDSNFGEMLHGRHSNVDALRNCGTVLMFQKLFSVYYYSSSSKLNNFHISPRVISSFYEIYTLHNISTDSTVFYSSNSSWSRFEKTNELAHYDPAKKYLKVCFFEDKNCGTCAKCIRTLTTLDAQGHLHDFSGVFDIGLYQRRRAVQIGYVISCRKESLWDDIYRALKENGKIPFMSWFYAVGFMFLNPAKRFMEEHFSANILRKMRTAAKKLHLKLPYC